MTINWYFTYLIHANYAGKNSNYCMLHVYKVKVGQFLTGCKMDYVYPSHEGHDPAGVTGLLSPIAHRDLVASAKLCQWSFAEETRSGHAHNMEASTTLDQGERNAKHMHEQAAMAQEAVELTTGCKQTGTTSCV